MAISLPTDLCNQSSRFESVLVNASQTHMSIDCFQEGVKSILSVFGNIMLCDRQCKNGWHQLLVSTCHAGIWVLLYVGKDNAVTGPR